MKEIICPHCVKAFKVDEAGYAHILKQVRDSEFNKQLRERLELAEQDKQNAVELAKTKALIEAQKAAATKDAEIQDLKARRDAGGISQKLAVSEALAAVEKERVVARAAFDGKAFLEKRRDMWCDRCHDAAPVTKLSHRSAMLLIRSGVASRYQ